MTNFRKEHKTTITELRDVFVWELHLNVFLYKYVRHWILAVIWIVMTQYLYLIPPWPLWCEANVAGIATRPHQSSSMTPVEA